MKTLMLAVSLFTCLGLGARATPLEIGSRVPEVAGIDQEGKAIQLNAAGAKGLMLVYFYPKADTPGCTAQACSLRDAYVELQEKGVRIFGVSSDKPEAQRKFKEKYALPFELIADDGGKVIDAFGVPRAPVVGFAARQAFLFRDGVLVWRDLKASTKEQAADVLKVLAESRSSSLSRHVK